MPTRPTAVLLAALAAVVGLALLLRHQPTEGDHDVDGSERRASAPPTPGVVSASATPEPAADATARLAAPPAADSRARVRLELCDFRGAPAGEGFSVAVRKSTPFELLASSVPTAEELATADVHGGLAEFEVPVAIPLELSVSHRDGLVHPAHTTMAALTAGEIRKVIVRLRPPLGILRGRLLLPNGSLATDSEITVAARFAPTQHVTTRTNAEGRFVAGFLPHPGSARDVAVHVGLGSARDGEWIGDMQDLLATPRALARVRMPFASGIHELGDLHLQDVPVLAEGRVVDEVGRPVIGAELVFSVHDAANPSVRRRTSLRTSTDANGRFCVREWGPEGATGFAVEVDHPVWSAAESGLFAAGEAGLQLVVRPLASSRGTFQLPADTVGAHVELVVVDQPDVHVQHRWYDRGEVRVLDWVAKGIAPGPYSLELRIDGEVRWRSGRLAAVLGECRRERELQALDLTAR